ncbi:hypothetical protein [Lentilactobacillus farraginis]|nr:hypothetical protein [Lentilactobacillus farraginis]GAF36144.1 hypothetical protein JCM14108_1094 [Lentilactobacillus farraginis DSM 18382 = JCM 14108]
MNKYILSALVVPVAFMGTTAAQAKTAALKAKVTPASASAKKITGKTVRGAHIKLTRGTVTYGVAKADRHGHFVLKLKHKLKGGWKYQVSISKAGYKTKSIGFQVKGLTKKAAKIKPVVPTSPAPTTPTTPTAPQAQAAQSSAPKPTTVGSQADVEADKVSNDIAQLNLQMDNFQTGRQTMTPFWRTSIDSQLQQLLNRINGLVTGNLRTDLLNTLWNAWMNLHQRFLNFLAGLNRQAFGGSGPAKSINHTNQVTDEIVKLQNANKQNGADVDQLTKSICKMDENLESDNFSDIQEQKRQLHNLQVKFNQVESKKLSAIGSGGELSLQNKSAEEKLQFEINKKQQEIDKDRENYKNIMTNFRVSRTKFQNEISQNNAQIQKLQSQQAPQTK